MSGGFFDYKQYNIDHIADEIDQIVRDNQDKVAQHFYEYSEETINEFKTAVEILRKAAVYAQRIDWLLCGDDGEDTFHKRLEEDLSDLKSRLKEESSEILYDNWNDMSKQ
jgi:hypothetical protein